MQPGGEGARARARALDVRGGTREQPRAVALRVGRHGRSPPAMGVDAAQSVELPLCDTHPNRTRFQHEASWRASEGALVKEARGRSGIPSMAPPSSHGRGGRHRRTGGRRGGGRRSGRGGWRDRSCGGLPPHGQSRPRPPRPRAPRRRRRPPRHRRPAATAAAITLAPQPAAPRRRCARSSPRPPRSARRSSTCTASACCCSTGPR